MLEFIEGYAGVRIGITWYLRARKRRGEIARQGARHRARESESGEAAKEGCSEAGRQQSRVAVRLGGGLGMQVVRGRPGCVEIRHQAPLSRNYEGPGGGLGVVREGLGRSGKVWEGLGRSGGGV